MLNIRELSLVFGQGDKPGWRARFGKSATFSAIEIII